MAAIGTSRPTNKVAAHWARKLHNRKLRRFAFLDLGATSGAAPEEDEPDLVDTGQPSRKTFMFPDGRTGKATKKMLLKHNLRVEAREMNIVPGLHSTLVSIYQNWRKRDTQQYSIRRERLFTMIILQKSQRQAPLSWNPSDVRTRECGSSTSTRQQP